MTLYTAFLTVAVLITRRQFLFAISHQESLWITDVIYGSEPKIRRNFVTSWTRRTVLSSTGKRSGLRKLKCDDAYRRKLRNSLCRQLNSLRSRVVQHGMVIVVFRNSSLCGIHRSGVWYCVNGYLVPHISRHHSVLIFQGSNCPRRMFKQKASFSAFLLATSTLEIEITTFLKT